jgi:ABC-type transport system involved in cytochrome bd biosynthesis fused ATPase/permease subunit
MPDLTYKQRLEQYGNKLTTQQKLYFQQEYDKQKSQSFNSIGIDVFTGGSWCPSLLSSAMGLGAAYALSCWTFIPVCVAIVECFLIKRRTGKYNEQVAQQILDKMDVIFSEPGKAAAATASN